MHGDTDGSGRLVLAATPIGDVDDASARLRAALGTADVIAAEDTRRLRWLTAALGIQPRGRVVSYHEHNEGARTRELVEAMVTGATVLVVTDAGMPSVSDPGYVLVRAAIEAGVPVTAVPGPSAVTTAIAVSGLPVDRFCFEGFLPRRPGPRLTRLRELADEPRTMVFLEAPHRLGAVLTDMVDVFGAQRPGAVCRELTKTHEEVRRGRMDELAAWAQAGVRGEITLVVAGVPAREPRCDADVGADEGLATLVVERVAALVAAGSSRRDAVAAVAAETGVRRRQVYDAVLRADRG